MIRVVKEPEGAGPPYERCCFCWRHTTWWHAKKDVAVCPECATTHKTAQIPKKADWCKQTAGLDNGHPPMTPTNDAPAPAPSGSGVREALGAASKAMTSAADALWHADKHLHQNLIDLLHREADRSAALSLPPPAAVEKLAEYRCYGFNLDTGLNFSDTIWARGEDEAKITAEVRWPHVDGWTVELVTNPTAKG